MHSYQCNWFPGSFSCIDCSLQCTAPAQWKAHTSCITEKEKYHGNFYTPKKNGKRPADQNSSQQPKKQQKVQHEAPAAKPEAKKKKEEPKSTSSTTGDQAIAWADLVESTLKEVSRSVSVSALLIVTTCWSTTAFYPRVLSHLYAVRNWSVVWSNNSWPTPNS